MSTIHRRVLLGLAACLAAALAFAPPALAQAPLTVTHARGQTELLAPPKTVITFDLAALDTLDTLGVPVAGVPTVGLPDYLSRYAGADTPRIGSLFEPDFEAINALQPDLIIVAGRSAPQFDALSKIAPTIDLTARAQSFVADAKRNAHTLGRLFGKDDVVDERLARLDASIASVKQQAADRGRGLIVLTTGNRMSAFGPGSRFGVLHADFGVVPADPKLDTANHGEAVSNEYILETDPDWLFVIDRDAAIGRGTAAKLLDNELVAKTRAWSANQVVYLDPVRWYLVGGGLTAMQASVDQIADAFAKAGD